MKLITLQIITISYFFTSCCIGSDPVQTGRYELSEKEKELIPYIEGQRIGFESDLGDKFDFIVTHESLEWEEFKVYNTIFCESDFFFIQKTEVVLESEIPSFTINFFMDSGHHMDIEYNDDYFKYNLPDFSVSINDTHFQIFYDSLSNISYYKNDPIERVEFHNSIQINNKVFQNVLESKYFSYKEDEQLETYPSSVFYNNEGLLQIIMSDNKTYYIEN